MQEIQKCTYLTRYHVKNLISSQKFREIKKIIWRNRYEINISRRNNFVDHPCFVWQRQINFCSGQGQTVQLKTVRNLILTY
jgi:hypothetical protein